MDVIEERLVGGKVYRGDKLHARYSCPECGGTDVEKQNDVWFCMARSGCGHASRREFLCVTVEEQQAIDRRDGRL